jgi:hypothetical protein
MIQNLDLAISHWLDKLSKQWNISIDEIVDKIGSEEIINREKCYPQLKNELIKPDIDVRKVQEIASQCFTLCYAQDIIRLTNYLNHGESATFEITTLLKDFPKSDEKAIIRINNFVKNAPKLGYVDQNGNSDWSGAAQFASVLLTSVYPNRFVDFRMGRWAIFIKKLEYDTSIPVEGLRGENYGEKILWAGKFASDFSKTQIFRKFWSLETYPLWRVASLSWISRDPKKPSISSKDDESPEHVWGKEESFRRHRKREDAHIVKAAKDRRLKTDPLLHCEVCNFSFKEVYGHLGYKFIEGHHHKKTIPEIDEGDKTNIDDIALVCSNCHSMIHKGKRVNDKRVFLTLEELRALIHK